MASKHRRPIKKEAPALRQFQISLRCGIQRLYETGAQFMILYAFSKVAIGDVQRDVASEIILPIRGYYKRMGGIGLADLDQANSPLVLRALDLLPDSMLPLAENHSEARFHID